MSSAVNAELANITSQVRAAFAYLRPCIARVRAGHPLGEVERHEVVDRRRAQAGALRRVHPVGEVEHVERRRASARPAASRAATRRCARRARRAASSAAARPGIPASASGITRRPSGEVGANATTSSPVARARPRRARRASRGCSCSRPSARARAARRRRRSSRVVVEREEVGAERARRSPRLHRAGRPCGATVEADGAACRSAVGPCSGTRRASSAAGRRDRWRGRRPPAAVVGDDDLGAREERTGRCRGRHRERAAGAVDARGR